MSCRRLRVLIGGCFCAAALLTAGCASTGASGRAVEIALTPSGRIHCGGRVTSIERIGAELKSRGVARNTRIKVAVPAHTPQATMKRIGRSLYAAGFGTITFVGPWQTDILGAD